MSTRAEFIVDLIRRQTGNQNEDGVYTSEIIASLNDAQKRLQSLIVQNHAHTFKKQAFIDVVANQLEYNLPTDIFHPGKVDAVYRKETSGAVDLRHYWPLTQVTEAELNIVYGYIIRGNAISLTAYPQSSLASGLMVSYTKALKKIEIRRGQITSLSPLTVNTATVPTHTLWDTDYLTIVDKDGAQKVTGIVFSGYLAGVITTASSLAGASVGDFVIYGANSTTHHEMPDVCEEYLRNYANAKINYRDSSSDMKGAMELLQMDEAQIVPLFAKDESDINYIPVIDPLPMLY